MRKIILLLIVLSSFSTVNAQEDRIVTITSIGQGKTKEEAKEIAIKKAISLTHQTFISSKKEILNNKAVNDEIVLNTNGQIQKTDVVSEIQLPNNEYVTTLNVTMSVTKLTSFFESKGEIVEFKGGVFSQNIKLQKLKEDSENSIIKNLCLSSFEILKNSVDFTIKHSQPTVIGDEKNYYFGDDLSEYRFNEKYGYYLNEYKPEDYKVVFTVTAVHNKNYSYFIENFVKTISSISMTKEEADEYKKLNKEVSIIIIDDIKYYLRSVDSINDLHNFFVRTNIIPLSFEVSSNVGSLNFLLRNRFDCFNIFRDDYNSFINARSQYYNYDYYKYQSRDRYKNLSKIIFTSTNIYPFYRDFFKPLIEFSSQNITLNYGNNAEFNNAYEIKTFYDENIPENVVSLNTKQNFETSFIFNEYFTLKEIETLDSFSVKKIDINNVLLKEEERLKNIKLVKLSRGGLEPYEDFYGRKFNDYQNLIGNGTIANLIAIQKERVLVKLYKTKCSMSSYCNSMKPGKLFYIPLAKVAKYLKGSEVKNEKGQISYQYN